MNRNQKKFIAACEEIFGVNAVINRDQIARVVNEKDVPQPYWLTVNKEYREGRGQYRVPVIGGVMNKVKEMVESVTPQPEMTVNLSAQVLQLRQPKLVDESDPAVPAVFENYVPFGFYNDLKGIVKSKMFYPVFVTGHSGNGKTLMVEQVCAELNRECIRVNISIETDESDLLGGPTLVDGNVVNRDGPVLTAMKRGANLLLDECLDESEEVRIGTVDDYKNVKLKDLNYGTIYPVVSFNMETGELENDTGEIISHKEDEVYEVELEDGRLILVNGKHPFIVKSADGCFVEKSIDDGLSTDDLLIVF